MTTAHDIPCYPVPDYPGYCVNRRGQIFGPRGMLKVDENYRCVLYRKQQRRRLYVGDVMERVGLLRLESTVEEQEDQARTLAVLQEKNAALHREAGLTGIEDLTRSTWTLFLTSIAEERGPRRANVYRKNLLAAWNWALDSDFPGFPQVNCPLERIRPFPVEAGVRYVPPEEDVIKVLRQAHGQDLVMLLTYYYTGARRGEVFRLLWSDVNFDSGSIRLVDHKGRDGSSRSRWVPMHPELAKALRWWQSVRPCVVDNVFM